MSRAPTPNRPITGRGAAVMAGVFGGLLGLLATLHPSVYQSRLSYFSPLAVPIGADGKAGAVPGPRPDSAANLEVHIFGREVAAERGSYSALGARQMSWDCTAWAVASLLGAAAGVLLLWGWRLLPDGRGTEAAAK